MSAIANKSKIHFLRSKGEKVIVGEGDNSIEVEVGAIHDEKVRLHFSAPRSVRIDRAEVRTGEKEK